MGNESIRWSTFANELRKLWQWIIGDIEGGVNENDPRKPPKDFATSLGTSEWRDHCSAVLELASIRNDGPNAPFGAQLFRTITSRSSDPRDKVFGILGISRLNNDNCAITPDYNKSVLQVSIQASAAVLKDYFPMYVGYQPWFLNLTCPSWVLDMERVHDYWRRDLYNKLYENDLTGTLRRGGGVTPIVDFLNNSCILVTAGLPMGRIVAFDKVELDPVQFLRNIRTELRSGGIELSAENVLSVLSGPYQEVDYKHDLLPEDIEALLSGDMNEVPPHLQEYDADLYFSDDRLFLTDTGHMGVCCRPYREFDDDGTFVVAALFGVQLPFILERVDNGYKLVALAHIDGHRLGDEHVEALGPNDDWRDLVRDGKMEEYRII